MTIAFYKDLGVYNRLAFPPVKISCDEETVVTSGSRRNTILRLSGAKEMKYNEPMETAFYNNRIYVPWSYEAKNELQCPRLCYAKDIHVLIHGEEIFNFFVNFNTKWIFLWPFIAPFKAVLFFIPS